MRPHMLASRDPHHMIHGIWDSVCVLYWYKSTNTDAECAATGNGSSAQYLGSLLASHDPHRVQPSVYLLQVVYEALSY